MAIKARTTGRTANDSAGLFDSRLRKGQATGLNRGTADVSSVKVGTVNKNKYKLRSRANQGYS